MENKITLEQFRIALRILKKEFDEQLARIADEELNEEDARDEQ